MRKWENQSRPPNKWSRSRHDRPLSRSPKPLEMHVQLQELRTLNYRRRLEQIFQRRYIQWNELFPSFYSTEWRSSTSSRVEPLTDLCQLHAGLERRLARPYSVALQQQRPVKARKEPAFFVKESSGQKRLLLKASRGQLAAAKHLSASLAIVNEPARTSSNAQPQSSTHNNAYRPTENESVGRSTTSNRSPVDRLSPFSAPPAQSPTKSNNHRSQHIDPSNQQTATSSSQHRQKSRTSSKGRRSKSRNNPINRRPERRSETRRRSRSSSRKVNYRAHSRSSPSIATRRPDRKSPASRSASRKRIAHFRSSPSGTRRPERKSSVNRRSRSKESRKRRPERKSSVNRRSRSEESRKRGVVNRCNGTRIYTKNGWSIVDDDRTCSKSQSTVRSHQRRSGSRNRGSYDDLSRNRRPTGATSRRNSPLNHSASNKVERRRSVERPSRTTYSENIAMLAVQLADPTIRQVIDGIRDRRSPSRAIMAGPYGAHWPHLCLMRKDGVQLLCRRQALNDDGHLYFPTVLPSAVVRSAVKLPNDYTCIDEQEDAPLPVDGMSDYELARMVSSRLFRR